MQCNKLAELQQQLDFVREELQRSPSQELKDKEDALCIAIKDHKISHNSGLAMNCRSLVATS
jgi:hypothetical protein